MSKPGVEKSWQDFRCNPSSPSKEPLLLLKGSFCEGGFFTINSGSSVLSDTFGWYPKIQIHAPESSLRVATHNFAVRVWEKLKGFLQGTSGITRKDRNHNFIKVTSSFKLSRNFPPSEQLNKNSSSASYLTSIAWLHSTESFSL